VSEDIKPSAKEIYAKVQAQTTRDENATSRRVSKSLNEKIAAFVQNYYQQREDDLMQVITEHHEEIDGDMTKLQQIMQANPDGSGHIVYRGIQLNGRFVVDHYPDWPISQE
jgi:hypothetical protein